MSVGLLGGTFDPIHIAHLILAGEVYDHIRLSRVVFMPSARPPHKPNQRLTSVADRIAMVRLAIEDDDRFTCSELEVERPGKSYTIETVRDMKALFGERERIFLILGSDNLDQFFTWKDPERLLVECELAIVPRPGYSIDAADPRIIERTTWIDMPLLEIASSDIRERVRSGRTIRHLVPTRVEAYIREKNLYS